MLLLDQGLPRSTIQYLRRSGIEARHAGNLGLAEADDAVILKRARDDDQIVVTLDADFYAQLALSGSRGPSVIRIRIEGLKGDPLAQLLVRVLERCSEDLARGALVTVTDSGIRLRRLPIPG